MQARTKMRIFSLILLLAMCHGLAAEDAYTHEELRRELLTMELEDQRYRLPGRTELNKAQAVNQVQVSRLKALIKQYGWPTIPMVGEAGEQAAWLIVQHADKDPLFQQQVLALITPLVSTGEVSAQTYAYLYDRVNQPQRYGTQGECKAEGEWAPYPIEDPVNVDSRRASVGLVPLSSYIDQVSRYLCVAPGYQ